MSDPLPYEVIDYRTGQHKYGCATEEAARDMCIALHLRDDRNNYFYERTNP